MKISSVFVETSKMGISVKMTLKTKMKEFPGGPVVNPVLKEQKNILNELKLRRN